MEEQPWEKSRDSASWMPVKEVIIFSNTLFKPRKFAVMIPNVFTMYLRFYWKNTSCGNSGMDCLIYHSFVFLLLKIR